MIKKLIALSLLLISTDTFSGTSFLVNDDWLEKNLNSYSIRLIDMSDDTQYQRFHIPGAIHLPYAAINHSNKRRVSFSIGQENIIKVLGLLGINSKHHIVIYDDMGGLHASRLFWELEKIGHKKISILDGGLVKWILSGKKVNAIPVQPKTTQYKSKTSGRDNTATLSQILSPDYKNILIDVRSKEEYTGHKRHPRSGHIPGAKWLEWQQAVDFENAFKLKNNAQVKSLLKKIGVSKLNAPITLYCQSGHRASHSYFTLRNLGYTNVKLYDGSMSEYGSVKTAPLTKGLNP